MSVHSEIRQFIIDNFLYGNDGDDLHADASLLRRGVIDSTGVLELVAFMEEQYGIAVKDEELVPDNLDSISKLSDFVARKRNNGGAP